MNYKCLFYYKNNILTIKHKFFKFKMSNKYEMRGNTKNIN
jgi:hypothetical protein